MILTLLICSAILAPEGVASAQSKYGGDHDDAARRAIAKAVQPQTDGSHLPRMLALRQLNDPDLIPLYESLLDSPDWRLQVHAAIALADHGPTGQLDVESLRRFEPLARQTALANAVEMNLITFDALQPMFEWDDLDPLTRTLLIGEQVSAGQPLDAPTLQWLRDSSKTPGGGASAMAAILLAGQNNRGPFDAFAAYIDTLPGDQRDVEIDWTFAAIEKYRIAPLAPWIEQHINADGVNRELIYGGLYTLLRVDRARGIAAWSSFASQARSRSAAVQYALVLLAADVDAPADAFTVLRTDHPLIKSLADVGRAFADQSDPVPALLAVLESGHRQSIDWAVRRTEDLPPDQASRFYTQIIEMIEIEGPGQPERVALGITAAARLYEIDPAFVLNMLKSAEDDSLTQQAILLGLFESDDPAIADAARSIRRIGSGPADSLVLLLIARHSDTLTADDLRALGRIAAGGGQVALDLRTQAAWLYLKRSVGTQQAIASVTSN